MHYMAKTLHEGICFGVVNWQEGQRTDVRDEKARGQNKEGIRNKKKTTMHEL